MKQTVPFLPKLKIKRHLSTIIEVRDEDLEECNNADAFLQSGRCENRRQRFRRRVYSCSDIAMARELTERHVETFSLPPLPNTIGTQRQALHGKTSKDSLNLSGSADHIFPDFKPSSGNCSILDFDAKVSRHLARPKLNAEVDCSHNKENIVASWLQFFGWFIQSGNGVDDSSLSPAWKRKGNATGFLARLLT